MPHEGDNKAASGAGADRFEVGPPPRWVHGFKAAPPQVDRALDGGAPTDLLLLDHQLFPAKAARYQRRALRVNNAQGVEAHSQVGLDFDPAAERLVLHSVRVWRDGKAGERADRDRFRLIQREPQLERQIFDGRLSALTLLEDVRAGDIIDIAATHFTDAAGLRERFSEAVPTALPVALQRWSLSVIAEGGSELRWTVPAGLPDAEEREVKPGWKLHRWRREDVAASEPEPNAPGWHLQGSAVEFTDFAGWAEVGAWVAGLWGKPEPPADLKEIARGIAAEAGDDPLARTERAFAFVRDEVRYLGLGGGIGSLKPHPPAEVLRRRFGDCKDKALLLTLLLRLLKVPATPVLVNTVAGRAARQMLPSPGAFDHVLVCTRPGGRTLWADPTRRGATAPLTEQAPPPFGSGLPVSAKATSLVTIPSPPADASLLVVRDHFQIKHPDRPVALEIRVSGEGVEAERLRELVGTLGRSKYRELRTAQLQEFYPRANAVGDWLFATDAADGSGEILEHYEIADFALKGGDGERATPFGPRSIYSRFPGVPDEADRRSPWALPYPCRVRHEIHFDLPFDLPAEEQEREIDSAAFGFRSQITVGGRSMDATYRYWSKRDHVPIDALATFRADAEEMGKAAGQLLRFPNSPDLYALPDGPVRRPPRRGKAGLVAACAAALVGLAIAGGKLMLEPGGGSLRGSGRQAPPQGAGALAAPARPEFRPVFGDGPTAAGADPATGSPRLGLPPRPRPGPPADSDGFTALFEGRSPESDDAGFRGSLLESPSGPIKPSQPDDPAGLDLSLDL